MFLHICILKMAQSNFQISDFLKTFGISTTTNFDLYRIGKLLKLNFNILMRNEIGLNNTESEIPIISNYQRDNQKGTHWILYWPQAQHPKLRSSHSYYFDSFGLPPIKELENVVSEYNETQVQPFGSAICGQLCLYVLFKLESGFDPDDIICELFETFKRML